MPDVTPLGHVVPAFGHDLVMVSFEEWPDRSVTRFAVPGAGGFTMPGGTWELRRADEVVAKYLAGGGGMRGGLNAYEQHFAPPVAFAPDLDLVHVAADGTTTVVPLRQ